MYRALARSLPVLLFSATAGGQVSIQVDKSQPLQTRAIPARAVPPANVRAEPTTSSVRLTWNCPGNASGFEIYATPLGGSQTKVASLGPQCVADPSAPTTISRSVLTGGTVGSTTSTMSFAHGDLQAGTEYTYLVRALSPVGPADAAPVTTKTLPLPAPGGFSATISGQTATLTWQPVTGAPGYQVFLQQQGAPEFKQIAQLPATATTYTASALPPGQTHRLYVQAVNGLPSSQSSVLSGRPFQFRGQAQNNSVVVHFAFGGTEGATTYLLSRAAAHTGPWLPLRSFNVATDGHAVVDTAGIPQLQRFYKLAVTYPGGTVESDVAAVTVLAPIGITQLRVKGSPLAGNVSFEWVCDIVATETRIYRALGTGPSTPMLDRRGQATVIPQTPYGPGSQHLNNGQLRWCSTSDPNAAAGGTYTYRVVASYNDNTTREATLTVTLAP